MTSLIIQGVLFMMLTGISWIIYGYVAGKVSRQGISMGAAIWVNALESMLFFSVLCLLAGDLPPGVPFVKTAACLIACGCLNYFQLDIMALAMARGPNGLIWALIQAGLIFPYMAGVCFYGSRLSLLNAIGIVCILIGILAVGYRKEEKISQNG